MEVKLIKFDIAKADAITQQGRCMLNESIETLKEHGFDVNNLITPTHYENIGGTLFPVKYYPNGIVIIDYPNI